MIWALAQCSRRSLNGLTFQRLHILQIRKISATSPHLHRVCSAIRSFAAHCKILFSLTFLNCSENSTSRLKACTPKLVPVCLKPLSHMDHFLSRPTALFFLNQP